MYSTASPGPGRVLSASAAPLALCFLLLGASCTHPSMESMDTPCSQDPLVEAVRAEGTLAVLVRLEVDTRPEAELDPGAVERQRERIAAARRELLQEVSGMAAQVVRSYDRLPFVAFRVDETALCRLMESPRVRSVQVDGEDPPTPDG